MDSLVNESLDIGKVLKPHTTILPDVCETSSRAGHGALISPPLHRFRDVCLAISMA